MSSVRCIGFGKKLRCRARIAEGRENSYFCCKDHEAFNMDFFTDGCCMCLEKDLPRKDIKMLRCGHVIHYPCYLEWLSFSTYENKICIVCRKEVEKKKQEGDKIVGNLTIKPNGVKEQIEEGDGYYIYDYIQQLKNDEKIKNNGNKIGFEIS
jgi:hypothetical protein